MVRNLRHHTRKLQQAVDDADRLQNLLEFAHGMQSKAPAGVAGELERLAERAQSATRGAGAAIAVSRQDKTECVARCGTIAPPLGSRSDATVGLCGECLRSGLPQFCMDAETDAQVDSISARALGARSLVYVPLFQGTRTAGVLGVFSDRKSHFTLRDLRVLTLIGREVTRKLHAETVPKRDSEANFRRREPGDVLNAPTANGTRPRPGVVSSLLALIVLAGIGLGYLAVQWTQKEASGPAIPPSQSTSASDSTAAATDEKAILPGAQHSSLQHARSKVQPVSAVTEAGGRTRSASGPTYLESVRTQTSAGHTSVALYLTASAQYRVHTLRNPDRIYIDLANVRFKNGAIGPVPMAARGAVQRLRVGAGGDKLRVVIDLTSRCTYVVRATEDPSAIVIEIPSENFAER